MHPQVRAFEQKQIDKMKQETSLPAFRAGDTLKVTVNVEERGKKWVQTSECVCISVVKKGISSSFLVRRVDSSGAVQMRFPFFLPGLSVQVLRRGRVRRAKLYYLERCSRKAGRIRELAPKRIQQPVPVSA